MTLAPDTRLGPYDILDPQTVNLQYTVVVNWTAEAKK